MPPKKKATGTERFYIKYKDEILRYVSKGVNCYECMARKVCKEMCTERNIDSSKDTPPCYEA